MNEKEMILLAAKAYGVDLLPCSCCSGVYKYKCADGRTRHFNPLESDDDALRLAVNLGMNIALIPPVVPGSSDPSAATRRAIVRAAANIGRNM